MKKLLIPAAVAVSALIATPASADWWGGGGGVGVYVGPGGVAAEFGGPYYHRRYYGHPGYYAYGSGDCRVIRERIVTPSGRVIIQTRRECY